MGPEIEKMERMEEKKPQLYSAHVEIDMQLYDRFRNMFPQKGMLSTVVRVKLAEFVSQAEGNMSGALQSIFEPEKRRKDDAI